MNTHPLISSENLTLMALLLSCEYTADDTQIDSRSRITLLVLVIMS